MIEVSENTGQVADVPSENTGQVADVPEVNEEGGVANEGTQSPETNHAFAEIRREKESLAEENARLQAELKAARDENEEQSSAYYERINADDYPEYVGQIPAHHMDEIIAIAEEEGIEPETLFETYLAESHADVLEEENETLREQLLEQESERETERKIQELISIDPNFDIDNMSDVAIQMVVEDVSAAEIVAYEQFLKAKQQGTAPDVIGKVESASAEKDFYTKDEVDKMSRDEIRKNLPKVKESMKKW